MPEIAPFTENENIVLKGGHRIKRRVVEFFIPWCAICKADLQSDVDEQDAYDQFRAHLRLHDE